ncbi:MBL fold metallo-hydrolase [Gilvibacter sediminis]|uniref:MBL fold metallo-hydrolase n=1 Tax=Gilvibacter sediminis TaxID=379071 RepID=UPI00234FCD31|nr:MBL fold metallo-hydrolase [Gilvibacter sediminis]MDC7996577.1 MBL fold metallo-hydrolase [Gilvibacter sediminis]
MKRVLILWFSVMLMGCSEQPKKQSATAVSVPSVSQTSLIVLGNLQDAGAPQLGCQKSCCADKINNPNPLDAVVSLGLVDSNTQKNYLFEATPNISKQLAWLQKANPGSDPIPSGIFLTHAHIGHYSGLMHLGKEAASTRSVPVYAMPRMDEFLRANAPWSALSENNNISLRQMDSTTLNLSGELQVTPILVPHRDEYSETVGYHIIGPNKSALFIPDIDKWALWEESIIDWIGQVDYAFLDATFYSGDELGGRDMSQIPHPSIEESMTLFDSLSDELKSRVYFIHFNHTNPALDPSSEATTTILNKGYNIAQPLEVFAL